MVSRARKSVLSAMIGYCLPFSSAPVGHMPVTPETGCACPAGRKSCGISARSALRHAVACGAFQRRVRGVGGWSRSSPRPFGAPPPSARRPTLAQRHPFNAGCGQSLADRAVPRAPSGRLRRRHAAPRWRSGTPSTPGAGNPWLIAQFPAPFGAPPPSARRPTLAQRHPFNAWCGSSVAGRAVPRAPSGRLRNCGQSCLPQCLKGLGGGRRRHLVGTEVRRCPRPVPTDGTSDHGVAHVADGGQK